MLAQYARVNLNINIAEKYCSTSTMQSPLYAINSFLLLQEGKKSSTFNGWVALATIATIAIDRYLAFRLLLRYRELVKLNRVICVLVVEWIIGALWSGSWFWSARVNLLSGALSIHRGLRCHVAQIHQQRNFGESVDFNVLQYKKTVNDMLWIFGLLVCYIPYLSTLFCHTYHRT